jgi:hypothetical protein
MHEPRQPKWSPDPDERDEQAARFREQWEEWQVYQDDMYDRKREERMNDEFDDSEEGA